MTLEKVEVLESVRPNMHDDTGGDGMCVVCGVSEEAMKVDSGVVPYTPTVQEVRDHEATHMPYRNWCPTCIRAKAATPAHRINKDKVKEGRRIPRLSMDYMYMQPVGQAETNPILVLKDSRTKNDLCDGGG